MLYSLTRQLTDHFNVLTLMNFTLNYKFYYKLYLELELYQMNLQEMEISYICFQQDRTTEHIAIKSMSFWMLYLENR